jgi:hypothetical protein
MTEPASLDPEVPRAVLAGKEWPIPELVWRDLRKCRGQLIELNGRLSTAIAALDVVEGEDVVARWTRHLGAMAEVFNALSNEDCDRLVMEVLFVALSAAHPSLSREEFESWRTTETERQTAWLVVRRQSGLFVFINDGAGEADPSGEAAGAA